MQCYAEYPPPARHAYTVRGAYTRYVQDRRRRRPFIVWTKACHQSKGISEQRQGGALPNCACGEAACFSGAILRVPVYEHTDSSTKI